MCVEREREREFFLLPGAGKTYTMLGKAGEPGIMALTLSDLFSKMEQNKAVSKYRVTMAYVEVSVCE